MADWTGAPDFARHRDERNGRRQGVAALCFSDESRGSQVPHEFVVGCKDIEHKALREAKLAILVELVPNEPDALGPGPLQAVRLVPDVCPLRAGNVVFGPVLV